MITADAKKASRIADENGLALYVLNDYGTWGDRTGFDGLAIWHGTDRTTVYPVYYWAPAADGDFPDALIKAEPMAHFQTYATHAEILTAFGYSL